MCICVSVQKKSIPPIEVHVDRQRENDRVRKEPLIVYLPSSSESEGMYSCCFCVYDVWVDNLRNL